MDRATRDGPGGVRCCTSRRCRRTARSPPTGSYSDAAQKEIIDDRYPIVLIDGDTLATHVRRMAITDHNGDLNALLDDIVRQYPETLATRRPEEVLAL
jgi:hypothetical protein